MENAAGVILCGGRSTRMGQPKAWLPWQGQTLLKHAISQLGAHLQPILICAAAGQELPALPPDAIRLDDRSPDAGPLSAMADAFSWLESAGIERAFVLGVDLPFVEGGMATFLLDLLEPQQKAIIPVHEGRLQPVAAAYRTEVASAARSARDGGIRSLHALIEQIPHRRVYPPEYAAHDPTGYAFVNINTPEAYEHFRRQADSLRSAPRSCDQPGMRPA